MKAKIFLLFVLISTVAFGQTTGKVSRTESTALLKTKQVNLFHQIKHEYVLEITEIAHSFTISDKKSAMVAAWNRRNTRLKEVLSKKQLEEFLSREKKPIFLRENIRQDMSKAEVAM